MIALLRGIARLVAFLLLVVLAVCALAVAVASIGGAGAGGFGLPGLAELVRLPQLADLVRGLFEQVEGSGGAQAVPALAGLGAVLVGILLLVGALWPRRERLVRLEDGDEGTLAARRRALGQVAAALAEQSRGVTATKVRVRPRRGRRGGRLEVRAVHPRSSDAKEVERQATGLLEPLTDPFSLKAKVRPRLGESGARVN
ncbi:MAG: hypothetical protein AVDCRST_MAG45-1471 [uncultured Solirubrobacterales bacterium]|uniref:Alkaline shock response membrane anchor protein AmaP n=1 Tax=uncultured Solirubrobacterales bacterium TaxID=768556 RepID=A0A6J4SS85_9ACTN|nr:MAG: hypothetical protein AVDCRST_MAG45-1471 [uncultured Solirubrobacterales bacterium]